MDLIQSEARWAAAELGDARSLDVFHAEGFRPRMAALSDAKAAARYGEQINIARKAAYDRALAAVASPRFARLLLEVAFWMEDRDWRGEALLAPIGPFAAETLADLRRSVRHHGAALSELDQERRHKLRLRTKRLRYATQFFDLAFADGGGKRRRRFIRALKALQERLGRLNDIATAEGAAQRALDGARAPALAFAAGQIVGEIKSAEPVEIEKAAEAYDKFAGAKRYWPKPASADPR
jgi:triphosphatase